MLVIYICSWPFNILTQHPYLGLSQSWHFSSLLILFITEYIFCCFSLITNSNTAHVLPLYGLTWPACAAVVPPLFLAEGAIEAGLIPAGWERLLTEGAGEAPGAVTAVAAQTQVKLWNNSLFLNYLWFLCKYSFRPLAWENVINSNCWILLECRITKPNKRQKLSKGFVYVAIYPDSIT